MKFNALILLLTLTISSYCHDILNIPQNNVHSSKRCDHSRRMANKQYASPAGGKAAYRRSLTTEFESMRIVFDYTYTLKHEKVIISELIMPSVKKFLEGTLSIRRFPGKIRFPKSAEICGELPIPKKYYKNGVDADLVIFVSTHKGVKKYNEMISASENKTQNISSNNFTNNISNKTNLTNANENVSISNNFNLPTLENVVLSTEDLNLNFKKANRKMKNENKISHEDKESLNNYLHDLNMQTKNIFSTQTANPFQAFRKGSNDPNNSAPSAANIFGNSALDPEEMSGTVGYSMQCLQDIYTLRPLAGQMHYVARILPNQRSIEEAIWTTIHEISHILAMDYELYSDFIDEEYNRKGYEKTLLIKTKFEDLQGYIEKTKNLTLWVENKTVYSDWGISHPVHTYGVGGFVNNHTDNSNEENNTTSLVNNSTNSSKNKTENHTMEIKNLNRITILNTVSKNNSNINQNKTFPSNKTVFNKTNREIFVELKTGNKSKYINITNDLNLTILILTIENFFENTKLYLKTPKLVKAARSHFNCSKMIGVELEHFGGPGSAFSHWSKRILNTEFMIADSYGENYVSNITLALFEDSGWYKVNYKNAQTLLWGKDKGCGFLENNCIIKSKPVSNLLSLTFFPSKANLRTSNNMKLSSNSQTTAISTTHSHYTTPFPREYCTNFNADTCSLSKIFRGSCYLNNYTSPIPKDYQYFDDPRIGGSTQFGDYCTYPMEWMDPFSGLPLGSCRNGLKFYPSLGESICENCRCFMSTLVPVKHKAEFSDKVRSICYETKCKLVKGKTILTMYVNNAEIVCPENGGYLSVDGFDGFVECPPSKDVCVGALDVSGNEEFKFFHNLCEKLLNIVLEFIDWLYKR